MSKVGIALVPNAEMIEAIVQLQQQIIPICPLFPILTKNTNLPHITLLQGRFTDDAVLISVATALSEYLKTQKNLFTLHLAQLKYVPQGWYFLTLYPNQVLISAHNFVFQNLSEQMFVTPSDLEKDISTYNNLEKSNYLRYGYRYIRDAFHPHITLGRTGNQLPSIAEQKIRQIVQNFLPQCTGSIAKITIYQLGKNGSHATTIHAVNIA